MGNEASIRLAVFLGLLIVFSILEAWFERKPRVQSRKKRWTANILVSLSNSATIALMASIMPVMVVSAALWAQNQHIGLLHLIDAPIWIEFIATLIVLDCVIWAQHWAMHQHPILWRLHRVHHSDRDLDASSGVRFHPLEIALSICVKILAVIVLGPMAIAVITYEITLNSMALFNHANIRLTGRLERLLRLFIVTPDMHRVHHSVDRAEHDTNYGNLLSVWDYMFGTYQAHPKLGHDGMTLGLQWQDDRPTRFSWLICLPFFRK